MLQIKSLNALVLTVGWLVAMVLLIMVALMENG